MPDTLARMRQLIGTTDEWTANNLVLGLGEIGVEIAAGDDRRFKIGDGVRSFASLPYSTISQAQLDGVSNALASETAARIAGDNAAASTVSLARSELLTEPAVSELASMWSAAVAGEPTTRAGIPATDFVNVSQDGQVIQVTGAAVRAPRAAYRLFAGHLYEVIAYVHRQTNPTDPAGDSVAFRAAWLDITKAQLGGAATLDSRTLMSGDGLWGFRKVVSLAAGTGVDVVAPAGAVYWTPFVQTFGANGVTNVLPYIRVTDLTSNTLVSADVTALNARVTALESINSGARLTALESVTGTPNSASFNTVADATAATIGATVARVMVYGTGFDANRNAQYVRVASGQDFTSADGGKWGLEFASMPVISTNMTYTIAPSGAQFTEPGAFMVWLDRRRIAPGVLVTATIAAGTYNCTMPIIGHVDGIRLKWTGPAMIGGNLAAADFTILDATFAGGLDSFLGMSTTARATASAACLAHLRTRYAVILQFDGTFNIAVTLNNRHSGDWSTCPCLFANVLADGVTPGTCQTGVTTGDAEVGGIENGAGPGGVGIFSLSTFHGFTEACHIANYGGLIDIKGGASTFGGFTCVYSQFGGVVRGPNPYVVGGLNYGIRNNHGGWLYLPAVYLHGNAVGAEATSTPSMYWAHNADVQFNYIGVQTTFGGSGKIALGICKNNARFQATIGTLDGNLDVQAVDMASTQTYPDSSAAGGGAVGPPSAGISGSLGGAVGFGNFGTTVGVCTGHKQNIFAGGNFAVFVGVPPNQSNFAGSAYTFSNRLLAPDAFSGLIVAPNTGRGTFGFVEVPGSTLVIPTPTPRVIGVVRPAASAGTPITITSFDITNWTAGDLIHFVAPRTGTGETVTFNDDPSYALASASRYLVNAADVLSMVRPTTTAGVSEVAFARNFNNSSSSRNRVRVAAITGAVPITRDDDIVVINKAGNETTAATLDAALNFAGSEITVKDGKGNAASFNTTITPGGGFQIDGAATYVINTNRGSVRLACDGTAWNVISKV